MHTKLLLIQCLVFFTIGKAVTSQVRFQNATSFEQMKAIASASNKSIFIDAYTDWCGPCKLMDTEVFSDSTVASFIHENFEPFKLEVEKDSLGQLIAMKYAIAAYPSFIVLRPSGALQFIIFGYNNPASWLANLKMYTFEIREPFEGVSENLVLDWPELYRNGFIPIEGKRVFPSAEMLTQYLESNSLFDEVPFRVVQRFQFLAPEKIQQQLLNNRKLIEKRFGLDAYSTISNRYFQNKIHKLLQEKDYSAALLTLEDYKIQLPENKEGTRYLAVKIHLQSKNYTDLLALIEDDIDEMSAMEINQYCWELYLNCEDAQLLTKPVEWMRTIVTKQDDFNYFDTYAALLYKTGNLALAEDWARKAIALGKQTVGDISSTEELLERIRTQKKLSGDKSEAK